MNNAVIPTWFRVTIADGLQRLMSLSLPGHPASETIKATAKAWTEAIWSEPIQWQQELDQIRLEESFLRLSRKVEHWPSPSLIIKELPKRQARTLLAAPQLSEAQRKENRGRLKKMMKQLNVRG